MVEDKTPVETTPKTETPQESTIDNTFIQDLRDDLAKEDLANQKALEKKVDLTQLKDVLKQMIKSNDEAQKKSDLELEKLHLQNKQLEEQLNAIPNKKLQTSDNLSLNESSQTESKLTDLDVLKKVGMFSEAQIIQQQAYAKTYQSKKAFY